MLGLPKRLDGQTDPAVWFEAGVWKGADSLKAVPFWTMAQAVDIVWGPSRGGRFVAICKKTRSDLGWKSIGFVIPAEGMLAGKSIWDYSHSVNWIENQIGYNLFPKLPAYLQEIIEEMTATELLCPYSEFDQGLDEGPDREIDYDREADYREME